MTDETIKQMKKLTRDHTHKIWEIAKSGELDMLTGEDRRYAEAMLEHKDEYFNEFEMTDLTYDYEYDPDTEQNPFIHITFHVIVENQLADKDPIEAFQFYNSMRKKKYPRHDTIHLIGAILAPFVFSILQHKTPVDMKKYRSLLKKYKDKKPERIKELVCRTYRISKDELSKTKRGIFNEPRGVAIYLTRMIRSDGLMDICKDYNLAKYSSASSIVETVRKKLQKDRKFRNRVNALSQKLIKSQSEI